MTSTATTTFAPAPLRLHICGIPHTITTPVFSHCAFTGKVLRFSPMMRSVGYDVYHYGVQGSTSGATKDIDLLTTEEWQALRVASYMSLHPDKTEEEVRAKLADEKAFVGDLGNTGTPLYKVFNERLKAALQRHYRGRHTDLVCLPFGTAHLAAVQGWDVAFVESGIGYGGSFHCYRVFESYAWMHVALGEAKKPGQSYWFVAPNYFDVSEWRLSLTPTPKRVGFLGRICGIKGMAELVECARRMPDIQFVICGQGNPEPYIGDSPSGAPNIVYKAPIHGTDRSEYLGSLCAVLTPSKFIEPFCGVNVEAQLCGTPVICHDFGVFPESVKHMRTGVRCHTLEDYCHGVRLALGGYFDRAYIRARAIRKYDMFNVARRYDYIFRCLLDVQDPAVNGWYSKTSHLPVMDASRSPDIEL